MVESAVQRCSWEKNSENMQQSYRRTPMPRCDFNKVALLCNFIEIALRHGCSPVNLLHIFRTPFLRNTSKGLLLDQPQRTLLYIKLQILRLQFFKVFSLFSPIFWNFFPQLLIKHSSRNNMNFEQMITP